MKIVTTTAVISHYITESSIAAPLPLLAATQFRHLDLSFYNIIYPGSPWISPGDGCKREVDEVRRYMDELQLDLVQAHSPDGEHFEEGERRDALLLATERSIEACGMLGIPHTVIHAAGYKPEPTQFKERNYGFYRLFADAAEKYNVDLLTENSSSVWNPDYLLLTGRDMAEFVAGADIPRLHICWDTGHGNCERLNQYDEILAMGSELHALHMQDNFGESDLHITPTFGTINYDRVMQGLKAIGYTGNFTFEDTHTIRRNGVWPVYREFVQSDDKLGTVPVPIVQKLINVSYEIGCWMAESYGFTLE